MKKIFSDTPIKKIAFLHLAFLYSGGGEKLALKEIDLLKSVGFEVDCYSPLVNTKECYPDIINNYKIRELIPGFTNIFHKRPEIGIILCCLLFPFFSYKFRKYDLIFGANQPGPLLGLICKILWHKPYLAYIAQPTRIIYQRPIDREVGLQIKHRMQLLPHIVNILRPLFYWIDLKSITSADIFLTNGKYMQEVLEQVYGKAAAICSPGAKSYYEYQKKNKNSNQNTFNFKNAVYSDQYLFISNRHFPQKKFEFAIEAYDKLQSKIPLLIAGKETEYTQQIKKIIDFYRLNQHVKFLGYVNENELQNLYRNCAIYLYTAPEEDFGMGIIEAMGYAKPVIAFNKAGPSRIITHKYDGYLADVGDVNQIRDYIEELIRNPSLARKIGLNAANTVKKSYSWGKHSKILKNQIDQLYQPQIVSNISPDFSYQQISY